MSHQKKPMSVNHVPSPGKKHRRLLSKKQTPLPNGPGPDGPPLKIARWFLLVFAVVCSVLGVIKCLPTGNFIGLAILNAPLLIVLHYYFPKRNK
jgi:hypothetical protein